jgi:lipoprotein LprG
MIPGRALAAAVVVVALAVGACGGDDDGSAQPPGPTGAAGDDAGQALDADEVVAASAAAMGAVESVAFDLVRTGAPLTIGGVLEFESMSGRFTVPHTADAIVTVRVGGITTELGAVAVDGEVWLSNPVSGRFEPLPEGFDVDPSTFFDPVGGWSPLLEDLQDAEVVGVDDDGVHVRGVAPAARMTSVTGGLVDEGDIPVELWIDPATSLVTAGRFTTGEPGDTSDWALELHDYGETFDIQPPDTGG